MSHCLVSLICCTPVNKRFGVRPVPPALQHIFSIYHNDGMTLMIYHNTNIMIIIDIVIMMMMMVSWMNNN